jgi:hypothetical protein|tara:strand:+ start:185 stop:571 length:387 start_codon:yes stop_codon:yes gene_type:complete
MTSRKKDLYWHKTAALCLEHDFKPAVVAKVVKDIFPLAEVNGRHIGAYKRRLVNDGLLDIVLGPNRGRMTSHEMIEYCRSTLSPDDEYVYNCSVGSHKRSLKCFEYKLTVELNNDIEEIKQWIVKIKK